LKPYTIKACLILHSQAGIILLLLFVINSAKVSYILPASELVYGYAQSVPDLDRVQTPASDLLPLTFWLQVPESLQQLESTQLPVGIILCLVQSGLG